MNFPSLHKSLMKNKLNQLHYSGSQTPAVSLLGANKHGQLSSSTKSSLAVIKLGLKLENSATGIDGNEEVLSHPFIL